jgi:hypothetical protein
MQLENLDSDITVAFSKEDENNKSNSKLRI